MENLQYTVKKGDSLIKIARSLGLNSIDELIELNPELKANPNLIRIGQTINLPDYVQAKSSIPQTVVSAKMPNYDNTPYAELPASIRSKVDAYTQAIRDGKMDVTQVPQLYQQQVFNNNVRQGTNEVAPYVMKHVMLAPWSIADSAVRGTLNEGRKVLKRIATGDKSENDYGIHDYFGNFSWLGKDFEQEHPITDLIVNASTTPVVMVGGENLAARAMDGTLKGVGARLAANARATANAMGIAEQEAPRATEIVLPGRSSGTVYRGSASAKGLGKTGTATRGTRGGFSKNASAKGNYGNKASYTPKGIVKRVEPKAAVVPESGFTGTGYWHGIMVPLPEERRTPYVIVEPEPQETHIEHTEPANPWIYNTKLAVQVPYRYGEETTPYYKAEAPRGKSVKEQPIMKDTAEKKSGRVVRSAEEKEGPVKGSQPSTVYYSGFGFIPGAPIVTRKKGGILKRK